jgi:hypothetical protein
MRAFRRPPRLSSSSLLAGACSPIWLLLSRELCEADSLLEQPFR